MKQQSRHKKMVLFFFFLVLALFFHELVKLPFTKPLADALGLGDVVAELLDRDHLLLKVVRFQEVAHLGVALLAGAPVQVEDRLMERRKKESGDAGEI